MQALQRKAAVASPATAPPDSSTRRPFLFCNPRIADFVGLLRTKRFERMDARQRKQRPWLLGSSGVQQRTGKPEASVRSRERDVEE
jgi:hypothetical protein